mgnify:CR=1 FL=1
MEKSVLKHTGWLMFIVVAVLLLMGLLPGTTIGTHVLRRVDILGDVRLSPEAVSEPDTPESEARLCGHLPQRNDLH